MAAPIGPGDWLLCILPGLNGDGSLELVAGRVYCVDRIDPDPCGPCDSCGDEAAPGLQLVGMPDPNGAWCHCAFKPLGGGERLTAPPARVCEPA